MAARRKGAARAAFKLTSPDIRPNGPIAMEQVYNGFGCSGQNVSPALKWSGAPADVPTATEAGMPSFQHHGGWFGLFAPAGTPPEILNRIHAEVRTAFANAQFRERLDTLGSEPVGNPPAEFKQFVSAEIRKYAEIMRLAKIQPE